MLDQTKINIGVYLFSVFQLLNKKPNLITEDKIFSIEKQISFIESLLIRIPVNDIFIYSSNKKFNEYKVIDGSKRLNAVFSFIKDEFKLVDLEYLEDYNNMTFSELPPFLRRRIEEITFTVYMIMPGSPEEIVNNIIKRIK